MRSETPPAPEGRALQAIKGTPAASRPPAVPQRCHPRCQSPSDGCERQRQFGTSRAARMASRWEPSQIVATAGLPAQGRCRPRQALDRRVRWTSRSHRRPRHRRSPAAEHAPLRLGQTSLRGVALGRNHGSTRKYPSDGLSSRVLLRAAGHRPVKRMQDLHNAPCPPPPTSLYGSAETWPSGRRHTPAKGAGPKGSRGFESLRLRHHHISVALQCA